MHISQSMLPILFFVLLGMVLIWFVLIKLLFDRLAASHPQKYEAMGRPSLFLRNSPATGWATLKFLVMRQYRALGDGYLSKLSTFMLIFFAAYLVVFFGLCFFILGLPPASAP